MREIDSDGEVGVTNGQREELRREVARQKEQKGEGENEIKGNAQDDQR